MSILDPQRTAAMQAVAAAGSPFIPDRQAFAARIEAALRSDREAAAVAKAHLLVFASRVSAAMRALHEGHLGSARAFLEIGQRDYQAAIHALPR
jgi:hypothetical protein